MKTFKSNISKFIVASICVLLIAGPLNAKASGNFDPAAFRGPSESRGASTGSGGGSCSPTGASGKGAQGASAPVNGGIGVLAVVGVAYGLRRFYLMNK